MAPWFVSSALVSGLGLVLILVLILRKTGHLSVSEDDLGKMGKLLGVFVAVDLFLFFCDLLTGGYTGAGTEFELGAQMLAGPLAPFFWTEVIGGLVALVLMFAPSLRALRPAVMTAAVLAVLGVLMKRVQLIEGGFQIPNLSYAAAPVGLPVGDAGVGALGSPAFANAQGILVYAPTGYEVGLSLCVISLGVCLFLLALYFLPLSDKAEH
jgi:molybdopterin-containing oxidoreductase family membrane subunit